MNTDLIKIDLYCKDSKTDYKVYVVTSLESVPADQRSEYKLLRFFMKPLTWKLHNELIRGATAEKGKGRAARDVIDWSAYKEHKAVSIIADWNLVDDDGNKVDVEEEAIMSLHPLIIENLLNIYDSVVLMTKKHEKKLILETFKYYQSALKGSGGAEAPPEVVELSLMEKFNWTPQQIGEIPYRKIQEIFVIMHQREQTQQAASSQESEIAKLKGKK